jgi:hypothetical protein
MRVENFSEMRRLIRHGVAKTAQYHKDTDGVQTLIPAASGARRVLITVRVAETFDDNGGTQPTFKIGETDTDDKFAAAAIFDDAERGTVFVFAGTLATTKALIVTANDAATTGLGGIKVTAVVMPDTYQA